MKNFLDLLSLLSPRERRGAAILCAIAVATAVFDTLGVASVMPFLAVLANPGFIESNQYLAAVYRFFGFGSRDAFLMALGGVTLAVIIGAALFRGAGQYAVFRYVNMRRYSMSVRLLSRYLGQPYEFFLNRNSSDIAARILSEVDQVVDGCLTPGVQLVAYAIVLVMLIGLLLAVNPLVALFVAALVGGFYAVVYAINRGMLGRKGRQRREANRQRFQVAAEAFGGIKEVKLFGREQPYLARFSAPALVYARQKATHDLITVIPRHVIDAVAFGGALALTLVLMMAHQDIGAVLPILGLYAVAGYRLLPAAQTVYAGLARIRFNASAVDAVLEDLRRPSEPIAAPPPPMPFRRSIRLDDVTYRYPTGERPALSHVDIDIAAGSAIGFIGATGAGKTTAVDLILGLLAPTSGRVLIDGVPLTPGEPARVAGEPRLCAAGHLPRRCHRRGKHRLRRPQRGHRPRGRRARRPHRQHPRVRRDLASQGLRHHDRRARHPPVGRPAPARSGSPGRCTTILPCWCSTRRRARSIPAPRPR